MCWPPILLVAEPFLGGVCIVSDGNKTRDGSVGMPCTSKTKYYVLLLVVLSMYYVRNIYCRSAGSLGKGGSNR